VEGVVVLDLFGAGVSAAVAAARGSFVFSKASMGAGLG